jgi:hypothetical protein
MLKKIIEDLIMFIKMGGTFRTLKDYFIELGYEEFEAEEILKEFGGE